MFSEVDGHSLPKTQTKTAISEVCLARESEIRKRTFLFRPPLFSVQKFLETFFVSTLEGNDMPHFSFRLLHHSSLVTCRIPDM